LAYDSKPVLPKLILMIKIQAIVRSSKFEDVKKALSEANINFFTFYEVKGYGHQKGKSITYRGSVYDVGYIGRVKIELIVSKDFKEKAIETIKSAGYTGEVGDGLIYVTALEEIVNIRTGLKNGQSINT
jgi:nitrogen regulatory protein PII